MYTHYVRSATQFDALKRAQTIRCLNNGRPGWVIFGSRFWRSQGPLVLLERTSLVATCPPKLAERLCPPKLAERLCPPKLAERRRKEEGGSDTHHVLEDGDGFCEGLNSSCDLLPDRLIECPTGKSARSRFVPCPAPLAKIFLFSRTPNQNYMIRRPTPLEGRIAIVTDAGRDAVDAGSAFDEQR